MRSRGAERNQGQMDIFRVVIGSCGLSDLGYKGCKFTWKKSGKNSNNIRERLDRYLANKKFLEKFNNIEMVHRNRHHSDHAPIVASFNSNLGCRLAEDPKLPIRFEERWEDLEDCRHIVKDHWEENPSSSLSAHSNKIAKCLGKLKQRDKRNLKGSIKATISKKEVEIITIEQSNDPLKELQIRKLEVELESLLEEEEKHWKIRSGEDWLKWGDKNTKWFHAKASSKRKRNHMKGLFDVNELWVDNNKDMEEVTTKYFSDLFNTLDPKKEAMEKIINGFSKKISEEQIRSLDMPFSKEEVEAALKNMNPTKASGSDGAHALFYQKYWDIVSKDVTKICLEVFNEGLDIGPLNKTFITLIPKSHQLRKLEEFRPISLCSSVYKIIAKVLTNKLNKVLNSIISLT